MWADVAADLKPLVKRGQLKVLASRLNLKDGTLSRYLDAERTPDPVMAARICAVLKRDLGELAGLESGGTPQELIARPDDDATRELHGVGAPLVATGVAAGTGSLPEVPDEKVYFFHSSFMRKHGWKEGSRGRFCCIKLGSSRTASSMVPTIHPGAVILIDRKASPESARPRSLWFVHEGGNDYVVKRVTIADSALILESDNPDPQFSPRHVPLAGKPIQDVLKGKVLWWGTEASAHGG